MDPSLGRIPGRVAVSSYDLPTTTCDFMHATPSRPEIGWDYAGTEHDELAESGSLELAGMSGIEASHPIG